MKRFVELARIQPGRIPLPEDIADPLLQNSMLHSIVLANKGAARQELFLCNYPFESWIDTWTVDLFLADRAGLTKEICSRFQKLRINILSQDLSIESHEDGRPTGVIQMVCDMTHYEHDGTVFQRQANPYARLVNLIDYVAVEFWEILRWQLHQRQIHINRLRELRRIGLRAKQQQTENTENPPRPFISEIVNGVVQIKENANWDAFTKGIQPDADGLYPVTITFDTVERYIRVSALNPEKDYFVLEVPHPDIVGQIARFSSKLGDLKGENEVEILCGCLRLVHAGHNAIWRCLLKCEKGRAPAIQKEIERAFKADKETELIKVLFPNPVMEKPNLPPQAPPPPKGFWERLFGG